MTEHSVWAATSQSRVKKRDRVHGDRRHQARVLTGINKRFRCSLRLFINNRLEVKTLKRLILLLARLDCSSESLWVKCHLEDQHLDPLRSHNKIFYLLAYTFFSLSLRSICSHFRWKPKIPELPIFLYIFTLLGEGTCSPDNILKICW